MTRINLFIFFAFIFTPLFLFSKVIYVSAAAPCSPTSTRGCTFGSQTDGDDHCRDVCGPGWVCDSTNKCLSAFGQPTFGGNKMGGYLLTGAGLNSLISNVITAVGAIVGLVFFALLVMGGISYMTNGGDDKALAKAKSQIMNALVGLMIVFFAYWIVRIIGALFGINLLSPAFTGP